jgi:hypothetical protein
VDRALHRVVVNHFYVYAVDADFGPFFLKFCSYFPYNARLCINGHEWAKRQATKAGIGLTALDNGFDTCQNSATLQAICDRLGPTDIQALLDKWLQILPVAFTDADRAAGVEPAQPCSEAVHPRDALVDLPGQAVAHG